MMYAKLALENVKKNVPARILLRAGSRRNFTQICWKRNMNDVR